MSASPPLYGADRTFLREPVTDVVDPEAVLRWGERLQSVIATLST